MLEALLQEALIITIIASTIRGCLPMLLSALGETFVEAAGVLNLGIEGIMVAGAFTAFLVGLNTDFLPLGFLAAAAVGAVLGLVFAFLTVTLGVNQIVVGLGMTIFGHSASSLLHRVIFGNQFPIIFGAGQTTEIPFLSKIPVIGPSVFNQHWLVYVTLLSVPFFYFLLYKTSLGLRVRAVGETPWAADAAGVSVFRTRYWTIIMGCTLASVGGAFLAIGDLAFFVPDMVQGRGYIAIVIVMLGKWDPAKVFLGSLLFGFALSLTSALQITGASISPDFILMMPYLVVILTLIIFARSTSLPAALCMPYQRGER